jgi:alanyl-tRNA synthetase
MANEIVVQNSPVTTRLMSVDDARAEGAMALFGENYGDEVRVVSMGTGLHGEKANRPYSVELCGGTHVRSTGDIGLVRIVSDSPVAAGVRRIEALTGAAALAHIEAEERWLAEAAEALKVQPAGLPDRVRDLMAEKRRLEQELAELRGKLATGASDAEPARDIAGIAFTARALDGVPAKELRTAADRLKQDMKSGVVALVAVNDGKAAVVVSVSEDLTGRIDAVELVRQGVAAVGGKGGGGRPDMAQAGGPDGSAAEAAIAAVEKAIASAA